MIAGAIKNFNNPRKYYEKNAFSYRDLLFCVWCSYYGLCLFQGHVGHATNCPGGRTGPCRFFKIYTVHCLQHYRDPFGLLYFYAVDFINNEKEENILPGPRLYISNRNPDRINDRNPDCPHDRDPDPDYSRYIYYHYLDKPCYQAGI